MNCISAENDADSAVLHKAQQESTRRLLFLTWMSIHSFNVLIMIMEMDIHSYLVMSNEREMTDG